MNYFVHDFTVSSIDYVNHYMHQENYVFSGHSHDSWELNVVLSGLLDITYDNFVFSLKPGQAFISEPNIFHRNKVAGTGSTEMIVLHFSSPDLPRNLSHKIFELDEGNLSLLTYALKDLSIFLAKENISYGEMSSLPASFKKIIEVFLSKITQDARPLMSTKNKDTIVYNNAVQYMKNNLNTGCALSELTSACCVSPSKLKQIFKTYTGHGPITYYTHIRLEYGRRLLSQGHTIAEVSLHLGYSSQSYFSRAFKKKYNQSPLAFQQKYQDHHH